MPDEDSIVPLLSALYAAPTDPTRWSEFLWRFCAICCVNKAALIAHDLGRNDHRILSSQGSVLKDGGHLYESYYWQFDEWTSRLLRHGAAGKVMLGDELWQESEMIKSAYYNEFLKPFDIRQTVGVTCVGSADVIESLALYRGPSEANFGMEELAALRMIAPHLRIALATRRKLLALESRICDLESALDSMSSAVVLVDAAGKVIFLNKQARAILAQGGAVFLNNGRLTGKDPKQTAALRSLIDKAIATAIGTNSVGGGAMPLARVGKSPLHFLVSPIPLSENSPAGKAVAAVFLDDQELHPLVPSEVLRALFGLTPAEARLALSILGGYSVSEAAELNCVSRETTKSQMSAVFSKTGTRRQGELIRLLSRLGGPNYAVHSTNVGRLWGRGR